MPLLCWALALELLGGTEVDRSWLGVVRLPRLPGRGSLWQVQPVLRAHL